MAETKELVIRRANVRDAKQLAALEARCFSDPWSEATIAHDLEFSEVLMTIVAESEGAIIGYIDVQIVADECDIRRVGVDPDHRGSHIGAILMETMIHFTEKAGVVSHTLEVRADNEPALGLYKKFGFQESGRRPGYYDGEDGIRMLRLGDPEQTSENPS